MFERYRASRETRAQRLAALGFAGDEGDPDVGVATVVAALARAGRTAAAFDFAERTNGPRAAGRVARREALRDPGSDRPQAREAALAKCTPGPTLAELQSALPDSTALVHFNAGAWNEPTTAFVVTRDAGWTRVLPPADSLVDPVRRLALALQAGSDTRTQARALGNVVVSPLIAAMPAGVSASSLFRLPP